MATIKAHRKLLQLLKSSSKGDFGPRFLRWIALLYSLNFAPGSFSSEADNPRVRLEKAYAAAESNYLSSSNLTNAIQFARATFELADISTNDTQRAKYANDGIRIAENAVRFDSNSAAAHYYLGLILGELAQTKSLGAWKLVRQMEQEFLTSIALDPSYDHAGGHRSLGMLYRDTPGWPTSIGNKSKAREHLEKAVELAPDFPDNHLTLLEGYVKWKDQDAVQSAIDRYRKILPEAKKKYTGPEWQLSWQDWDHRWNEILAKAAKL